MSYERLLRRGFVIDSCREYIPFYLVLIFIYITSMCGIVVCFCVAITWDNYIAMSVCCLTTSLVFMVGWYNLFNVSMTLQRYIDDYKLATRTDDCYVTVKREW